MRYDRIRKMTGKIIKKQTRKRRHTSSTIVRNSSESSHHHHHHIYCSKAHAGARDSRPCLVLVKDAGGNNAAERVNQVERGQLSTGSSRSFLSLIQLRPEGRPAYPIKREEPSASAETKEWKSGDVPREQDKKHRGGANRPIRDSKLRKKERCRWAATHHRSLEVIHLALGRFINLCLRGRRFILATRLPLRMRLILLWHFGDRFFLQFHLLTSCPSVQLLRSGVKFETVTVNGSVSI